jgi:hypothetical protein
MPLTPAQRSQRSRLAAQTRHAQGRTNTAPARAAFEQRFIDQVDPDRVLPESERAKRAEAARSAHFTKMALASSKSRRRAS